MKYLVVILILFLSLCSQAQQTETYSQFAFNYYALNPAASGLIDCYDIKFGRRQQWMGFDGAPVTNFLSINKVLGELSVLRRNWHVLGGYMVDDDTFPYSFFSLNMSYAYHFRLHRALIVSVGAYVGFKRYGYSGDQQSGDPILNGDQHTWVLPDVSPGVYLYSASAYYGLSIKQAAMNDMAFRGDTIGSPSSLAPHIYYAMGRTIKLDKNGHYNLKPNLLFKYTPVWPPSIEMNLLWSYNRFHIGGGVRLFEGLVGIVRFPVSKFFDVGYAFDFTLNSLRTGSSNGHEIVIRFVPCSKGQNYDLSTPCPQFD